ncbi:MAG: septum formation initiator family protein [Candidatus Riflebacteria bacterium]|nr:septum formation initiator family protein [Candidatus Riflebacteria bacterium]
MDARPPVADEGQPKKKRVRFSAEVMFLVSVVFCVALSVIYLSRYSAIRALLQKEEEMSQRIQDLERENRRLKENLDTLSTPEGIERLARERLGLVKPEEVVIFPIPASDTEGGVIASPGR